MSKLQMIVDRIENGLAVCEIDGGTIDIPLDRISGDAKEGDILHEGDGGAGYSIAQEETDLKRAAVRDRFERLKKRSKACHE